MLPATFKKLIDYGRWSNAQLLAASASLTNEQLDSPFEMGRGNLRRTLMHIWAGESVWLARMSGKSETPWPDESQPISVSELTQRFEVLWHQIDAFLDSLKEDDLSRVLPYRDSLGGLFDASLWDMWLQFINHSVHHRAQAVNMLRRIGASPPELDYMMFIRKPVSGA